MPNGDHAITISREEHPLDAKCFLMLLNGRVEEAVKLVPRSNDGDGKLAERVRAGETVLKELGLEAPQQAAEVEGGRRRAMALLRNPIAKSMTIVFGGNTRMFALPRQLLIEQETNVLLLRDPTRCFGLAGIPGLGKNYPECIANLKRLMAALGADTVYVIGISAGGSAALKYGVDLDAKGVLGFSVPTTLDLDDDKGAEMKDYPQLALLYRHGRHLGIDLSKYYDEAPEKPGLMLVYSKGHARDTWLAERMRDVRGVELVETVGYDGHATYQWLSDGNKLSPLITQLFSLERLSNAA
jgi:hypothetical protein